jgi:hypothetical protein
VTKKKKFYNHAYWGKVAMADHFEKIQKLKDKIDGVPNFRCPWIFELFIAEFKTK